MENQDIIDAAYTIALINLRNNYQAQGIVAGNTHFSDVWTRDSCFASLGCLHIKDTDIVRRNLLTLLNYSKKNGQIPLRVGTKHFILKYLGFQIKTEARFLEDKYISTPTDSNSLFLIALEKYVAVTEDLDLIRNHFYQLKKVLEWNFSQDLDNDLLIEEGYYASWMDSLKKRGKVLYTNVLHYAALKAFAKLAQLADHPQLSSEYVHTASLVKDKILDYFWNGDYLVDWKSPYKTQFFSSASNLLAIYFDVVSPEQADHIFETISKFEMDKGFCIQCNYPEYKWHLIYPLFLLINLKEYHNGFTWIWIGCLYSIVQNKMGKKTEAINTITQIARNIVKFKGIYEVYCKGRPVKRLFYRSEQGFSWSSGIFAWACKEIGLK